MRSLDKYLLYSSIFALFTEAFLYRSFIDLKLFYIIIFINILILHGYGKFVISRNHLTILGLITIHGIVMFFFLSESIASLLAQLFGISLSSIYYYSFLKYFGSKKPFEVYIKLSFWVAITAVPMGILGINTFHYGRLNGIMLEPSHFVVILLPATYVLLKRKEYIRFIIMLAIIVLARSFLGYLGLLLIFIMPLLKLRRVVILAAVSTIIFIPIAKYVSEHWNDGFDEHSDSKLQMVRRIRQTTEAYGAVVDGKFQKNTNLSSYAFLSNVFVAQSSVSDYPFGTGLGSYYNQYLEYSKYISPPKFLPKRYHKINAKDGNSLLTRMTVDFGLFALIFVGYFVFRSIKVFNDKDKIIPQGTFMYLVIKLIREGHYFPPEFYFFLLIFIKDFDKDITYN